MFADAEDQDAVIADGVGARFPAFYAPALLGTQVEVVVAFQRRDGAEDLAADVQNGFTGFLAGREDVQRVVV